MAPVPKHPPWGCHHCSLAFFSAEQLCEHLTDVKHLAVVGRVAPGEQSEAVRLQWFLDTYQAGRPVVGLEYVVEEQEGSAYLYTCTQCNMRADWRGMFLHVIGCDHVEFFIYKHFPQLLPDPDVLRSWSWCDFNKTLVDVSLTLHKFYGRKAIVCQKDGVAGANLKAGSAATGDQSGLREPRRETGQVQKHRRWTMDSLSDAETFNLDSHIFEYLRYFSSQDHYCGLCSVFCPTTKVLFKHVTGSIHGGNLARAAPEKLKKFGRLQNFLDTYLEGEPILGLGYIAEVETDRAYSYTCLLCNTQEGWPEIFIHLMNVEHMARYLDRHHHELSPRPNQFCTKEGYGSAVIAAAVKVHQTLGDANMAEAASEDDGEEDGNVVPIEQSGSKDKQHESYIDSQHHELMSTPKTCSTGGAGNKNAIVKPLGYVNMAEAASEDDGEEDGPLASESNVVQIERSGSKEKPLPDIPEHKSDEIKQEFQNNDGHHHDQAPAKAAVSSAKDDRREQDVFFDAFSRKKRKRARAQFIEFWEDDDYF